MLGAGPQDEMRLWGAGLRWGQRCHRDEPRGRRSFSRPREDGVSRWPPGDSHAAAPPVQAPTMDPPPGREKRLLPRPPQGPRHTPCLAPRSLRDS